MNTQEHTVPTDIVAALMHHIGELRAKLTDIAGHTDEPRSAADAQDALSKSLRIAPEPDHDASDTD
jgi:hypothetical protein